MLKWAFKCTADIFQNNPHLRIAEHLRSLKSDMITSGWCALRSMTVWGKNSLCYTVAWWPKIHAFTSGVTFIPVITFSVWNGNEIPLIFYECNSAVALVCGWFPPFQVNVLKVLFFYFKNIDNLFYNYMCLKFKHQVHLQCAFAHSGPWWMCYRCAVANCLIIPCSHIICIDVLGCVDNFITADLS